MNHNYYHNIDVIKALGRQFNITPLFILQPTLFTKRNLSDFESTLGHLKFVAGIEFEKEVYAKARSLLVDEGLVEDFSGIFSDRMDTIYIDDHHMSSRGNQVVAQHMADLVLRTLHSSNN